MKPLLILFSLLFFFSLSVQATTYIVKEGGQEVGRYEDNDGKDAVQILENDKPKPRPKQEESSEYGAIPKSLKPGEFWGKLQQIENAKEIDPDLAAYLNRQPWMKDLRDLDKKYDLKNRLSENRGLIQISLWGFAGLWILYRVIRLIRWLKRRRQKIVNVPPAVPLTGNAESSEKKD